MIEDYSTGFDQRQEEIYNFLTTNELSLAVKRLLDFVRDFSDNPQLAKEAAQISNTLYYLGLSDKKMQDQKEKKTELITQIFLLMESVEQEIISSPDQN